MFGQKRGVGSLPRAVGIVCAVLVVGLLGHAPARAQANTGVIRLVVPYGAGGPTDVVARLLAVPLQNILQQTVIVENRAGAGSAIGARFVVNAPPDGRTILIANVSTYALVPATTKSAGYDPTKALLPIVQTSDMPSVMVTYPSFPASTVKEFVAYAKAHPGKISFGSAGVGNSAHLLGELIKARTNIDIVHIPYRSGAEMMLAVLGEQVQFAITDLSASIGQIREGKLKALALTGLKRSAEFPDLPTLAESGYPDLVLRNWTAATVPAGTPPAVVKRLVSAFNEAIQSADYVAAIRKSGGDAKPGTSEELGALIASDYKKWSDVAKAAGVVLE